MIPLSSSRRRQIIGNSLIAVAFVFFCGPFAILLGRRQDLLTTFAPVPSLSELLSSFYWWTTDSPGQGLSVSAESVDDYDPSQSRRELYSRRHPRAIWNASHIGSIHVLPVVARIETIPEGPWRGIPMPTKSHFADFDPPSDALKWNQALLQAARGEQVLLERVLRVIRSPTDLFENDKHFRWLHNIADYKKSSTKEDAWLSELAHSRGTRAPVVMLGYRKFEHPNSEGPLVAIPSLGPGEILKLGKGGFSVPRKIVAVGNMDENWGWLSTYFLNRTVPWAMSFDSNDDPFSKTFRHPQQQVQELLDNDNIVALIVSQHHNISHPKVISLPLGLENAQARDIYASMMKAAHRGIKKEILLFSAGSNYAYRPAIRQCIAARFVGEAGVVFTTQKVSKETYRLKLLTSMASVAMPGLGYDTYRLWETLAAGAMPVVERGMGMDRTLYRLPVLLLDDYAELSPELLRSAYVEALYRADQWEYERMTRRWWERLVFDLSYTASLEPLLHYHPLRAEDGNFTRPLVPFDCGRLRGGCGQGTKRVPRRSCAIDFSVVNEKYNFRWKHE